MSNGDDICVQPECGRRRQQHTEYERGMWFDGHAFVEPAAQPAPSGYEAKVREIAERLRAEIETYVAVDEACRENEDGDAWAKASYQMDRQTMNVVREAYVAGKADGAREERKACEKLIRARADVAYVLTDLAAPRVRKALHDIADAIARRGSEGK